MFSMSNADELRQRAVQSQKVKDEGDASPAADSKAEDEEPLGAENVSGMLRNSRFVSILRFVLSKNDGSGSGPLSISSVFFSVC